MSSMFAVMYVRDRKGLLTLTGFKRDNVFNIVERKRYIIW